MPKLNDARVKGHMVIVTRTDAYKGIVINVPDQSDYNGPVTGTCANGLNCIFQDGYKLSMNKKWDAVKNLITNRGNIIQGNESHKNDLVINFMSAAPLDENHEELARVINKRLVETPLEQGKQYGWIISDFVYAGVASHIYKSNNQKNAIININEAIEEEYAVNTESNIFTEEQVKHLYNGDKSHDRCIRKLKDVIWYRSEMNNFKEHLNMDNIKKYCNRYNCVKAYASGGSCKSKEEYWNTCKKNIIHEALNPWIPGNWKVKDINHC